MRSRKFFSPVFLLFFICTAFLIGFRARLEKWGFDIEVMLIGNLVLCIITLLSFYMLNKGLHAVSTAGFLRSVYGSFMIKLFLVAALVFGYVFVNKENINKPALFTCMFLYLVYSFVEIRGLLKLSKEKTDA
jgi:hypothetical protein